MPDQFKVVKIQIPPSMEEVNAYEIPVKESIERWSEIELEDGTKLRIKLTVAGAHRLVGKYDPQGNPIYNLQAMPQMVPVYTPDDLKKRIL